MFEPADYKLSDMLGIAGATIGIIIAAGIMLGNLSARYTGIFERFRALTGELRGEDPSDSRQARLCQQIISYRKQLFCLNAAIQCLACAVLVFLITVGVASLSVIFPKFLLLRTVGAISLFTGLMLIGVAVVLAFLDALTERPSITHEAADIDSLPNTVKTCND